MTDDLNLSDETIDKSSYKVLLIRWLSRQGVVTVLLFCILGSMVAGGHYAVTKAIPEHIKEIKSGYREVVEQITVEHRKQDELREKSYESERNLIRELMKLAPKPGMATTQKPNAEEAIP